MRANFEDSLEGVYEYLSVDEDSGDEVIPLLAAAAPKLIQMAPGIIRGAKTLLGGAGSAGIVGQGGQQALLGQSQRRPRLITDQIDLGTIREIRMNLEAAVTILASLEATLGGLQGAQEGTYAESVFDEFFDEEESETESEPGAQAAYTQVDYAPFYNSRAYPKSQLA